jgi:hypothetical protein
MFVEEKQEKEILSKLSFLFSVKMFGKYNYNLLRKLYMNSEPTREFVYGDVIYSEGEPANSFFVIKEGEFKVSIRDMLRIRSFAKDCQRLQVLMVLTFLEMWRWWIGVLSWFDSSLSLEDVRYLERMTW